VDDTVGIVEVSDDITLWTAKAGGLAAVLRGKLNS
jgi:hypothetical protein